MADLSDVENALCAMVAAILYPDGTAQPSVTGQFIKVYRGWPASRMLNNDLAAGLITVTVSARENASRNTTRYPKVWRQGGVVSPTLTVSVVADVVTFGGNGGSGQTVGLTVDGIGYAYAVTASDTPESVARAVRAEVGAGSVSGSSISIPGSIISGLVAGSGTSVMETRRQTQGIAIGIWCPDPMGRDLVSVALDTSLATIDWLPLPDGTTAKLDYTGTGQVDTSENANLYRRFLDVSVEYATLQTQLSSQMLFGVGRLGGSGTTVGFGCLEPRTPMTIPPLGAVRFDAWYDPSNPIDRQCAAALSPSAFNSRLPPNAYRNGTAFTWPLATQATMDAEITAALQAGLGFWAFDSYSPTDTLSLALQLYLSSSLRDRLRFCMLGQTSNWGSGGEDQPALLRDITMMTQQGYMTVLDGRPLYLVLDASAQQTAGLPSGGVPTAIALVRRQVRAAGGANPYVVWLSGAALADYSNIEAARQAGADAAAAYATPRLNGSEQSYDALRRAASTDWQQRADAGFPMIPTAMTGWDQRPLIATPQPFYPLDPAVSATSFYDTADPAELGAHVADLARFLDANSAACPAGIGLVYAWNELAEGGWLMPTWTEAGADPARAAAVGSALADAVRASKLPTITLAR